MRSLGRPPLAAGRGRAIVLDRGGEWVALLAAAGLPVVVWLLSGALSGALSGTLSGALAAAVTAMGER